MNDKKTKRGHTADTGEQGQGNADGIELDGILKDLPDGAEIAMDPGEVHEQGVLCAMVEDSKAALDHFAMAYHMDRANPLYAVDYALSLDASGKKAQARQVAVGMDQDFKPEREDGLSGVELHRVALVYTNILGNEHRALEYFAKAFAEDPHHPEIQISYAISLLESGYEDESYKVLEQVAFELDHEALSEYRAKNLARVASLLCRFDPARAEILVHKALSAFADNPSILREAGVVCLHTGDFLQAAEHFRRATELAPGFDLVWGGLQYSLFSMGMFEEAFELGLQILQQWPGFEEVRYNTASAAMNIGWHDEAMDQYQELISLTPNDSLAHMGLGICHALSAHARQARQHQRRGLELGGDDPEVQRLSDEIDRILDSGPGLSGDELAKLFYIVAAAVMSRKNGRGNH